MDGKEQHFENYYDENASYWDTIYKREDKDLSIYALHFRQRRLVILNIIKKLGKMENARVLEAGCGPGAYIAPLLEMGYTVAAVDQSSEMVETARKNYDKKNRGKVEVQVAKVDDLPYEDQTFDLVTNTAVLMYVADHKKVLSELYRVVKQGGYLILTFDNKRDLADLIDIPMRLRGLLKRLFPGKRTSVSKDEKIKTSKIERTTYDPRELKQALEGIGFEILEETSIGFAPFLFNGKRVFSDKTDLKLDRFLQFLRKVPILRNTGYTYICKCRRIPVEEN